MAGFHWKEASQAKTLYDLLLCSPMFCACLNFCVVLGADLMRPRQETKDYPGLKNDVVTKGPEFFFMHGALVYPLCDRKLALL